jgi:phosphoribosylformylglycinamidine cyclo-ligase
MKFVHGLHVIKNNWMPIPPVFKMIQEQGNTSWDEMYQVFNMGQRLEIYCPRKYAQAIIDEIQFYEVKAIIAGEVRSSEKNELSLETEHGTFHFKTGY